MPYAECAECSRPTGGAAGECVTLHRCELKNRIAPLCCECTYSGIRKHSVLRTPDNVNWKWIENGCRRYVMTFLFLCSRSSPSVSWGGMLKHLSLILNPQLQTTQTWKVQWGVHKEDALAAVCLRTRQERSWGVAHVLVGVPMYLSIYLSSKRRRQWDASRRNLCPRKWWTRCIAGVCWYLEPAKWSLG
jgi:hypothetical protein